MVNFNYKIKKVTMTNGETVENIRSVGTIGNDSFIMIHTESEKFIVPLASVAKMEIAE